MQQSHIVRKRGNDANIEYAPAKRSKTSYDLSPITPLAERLRPSTLSEFVGQSHLTRPDSLLMNAIRNDSLGSLIFWGPPGCGKTTLARLIAQETKSIFKELSATVVGINDVRLVFEEAKNAFRLTGRKTTLFLDEVHRFNKSQQDVFLPFVEQGHIQLIGATTENPSFKLTGALLSRCRVFTLDRLADDAIEEIIRNAIHRLTSKIDIDDESTLLSSPASFPETSDISDSRLTSSPSEISTPKSPLSASQQKDVPFPTFPHISYKVLRSIISLSTGDARCALSLLDLAKSAPLDVSESQLVEELRRSVSSSYDRSGDGRYDMISALHKSVRGSNVDAAMYWLARMLGAGEDPLYIARRMVVCASEDVGLADAQALPLAIAGLQACQMIGMPECRINLAHVVAYLAEAPKSTRSYEAYNRALAVAQTDMTLPVPLRIRNAPTHLMRDLGYAEGYRYNPDYTHPVYNEYMPSQLEGHLFMRKPDDLSGKLWDESALCEWETKVNGGQRWEGRKHTSSDVTVAP
ncbi:P-loop containing nucleoside triphosphate hydrolase protein [Dendrothele bispora CBS 962.96]|uniref:P-loop containing nucleoside triphosphate hydrolase protein n=1 Tax=Dendrothele bispora (strain CBS 962.96) TaxID=1314807 RepID=A0A4S8M187_DENBC|nr:P-loop containing nucleoside triphosphate hydrolase protein [Dendrothele bispora CBS 962.96]